MKLRLIIDTNILIAALIKDSITRKLLLHRDLTLLVIDYSLEEMKKYEQVIIKKSKEDKETIDSVLKIILSKALLIDSKLIKPNFPVAAKLIGKADEKDIPFVAAALTLQNDGIWSEDPHFEAVKDQISVWKTKDLARLIFRE